MRADVHLRGTFVHALAGNLSQRIGNPLVDGLAVIRRRLAQQGMDFRRGSERELPGIRNWRISRIAERFVSGEGCGRWRNKVSSPMVNLIREPLPSDTCAPQAIRSASTSRHLIEPLTGSVKIASSVALCLSRMTISTRNDFGSIVCVAASRRPSCATLTLSKYDII